MTACSIPAAIPRYRIERGGSDAALDAVVDGEPTVLRHKRVHLGQARGPVRPATSDQDNGIKGSAWSSHVSRDTPRRHASIAGYEDA